MTELRFACAAKPTILSAGTIKWTLQSSAAPRRLVIRFRIPAWSVNPVLRLNGQEQRGVNPGHYFESDRLWNKGDVVELDLDLELRFVPGDREAAGKVSLYRGCIVARLRSALEFIR